MATSLCLQTELQPQYPGYAGPQPSIVSISFVFPAAMMMKIIKCTQTVSYGLKWTERWKVHRFFTAEMECINCTCELWTSWTCSSMKCNHFINEHSTTPWLYLLVSFPYLKMVLLISSWQTKHYFFVSCSPIKWDFYFCPKTPSPASHSSVLRTQPWLAARQPLSHYHILAGH